MDGRGAGGVDEEHGAEEDVVGAEGVEEHGGGVWGGAVITEVGEERIRAVPTRMGETALVMGLAGLTGATMGVMVAVVMGQLAAAIVGGDTTTEVLRITGTLTTGAEF